MTPLTKALLVFGSGVALVGVATAIQKSSTATKTVPAGGKLPPDVEARANPLPAELSALQFEPRLGTDWNNAVAWQYNIGNLAEKANPDDVVLYLLQAVTAGPASNNNLLRGLLAILFHKTIYANDGKPIRLPSSGARRFLLEIRDKFIERGLTNEVVALNQMLDRMAAAKPT